MIKTIFAFLSMFVLSASAGFAAGPGGSAVPAGTATFDGGNCTATFVRSASGIVNETNRTCDYGQYSGVYLQFRPLNGTPNPTCDPVGLIDSWSPFSTSESTIAKWFKSDIYNVCVYLNPVSASIDVTDPAGSDVNLQIGGNYSVCISGYYFLQNNTQFLADAGYASEDFNVTWQKGLPTTWPSLGANIGNVQVDSQFIDWGAFNPSHNYCTTIQHSSGPMNLRAFDGYSDTNTIVPGWYSDNSGSLTYVIKFLGV